MLFRGVFRVVLLRAWVGVDVTVTLGFWLLGGAGLGLVRGGLEDLDGVVLH